MSAAHSKVAAVSVDGMVVQGQGDFTLRVPRLTIDHGSMVALVGRNGSGKSTFLEAMLNLIQADAGSVLLFGENLSKSKAGDPLRGRIGAQVQGMTWSWSIKVSEILAVHKSLYGHIDPGVIEALGLQKLMPLMYRKLSTGQRRRVDLAVALGHRPDLVVLDEPSGGLDRRFEVGMRRLLAERREAGATTIIATHDGQDVGMADRILWFENGSVIEDGLPDALLDREVGRFVGIVEQGQEELAGRLEQELGEIARSHVRASGSLKFFGDEALRAPFIAAMERHVVPGYVVRPTQPSDLLDLISGRAEEGAAQ